MAARESNLAAALSTARRCTLVHAHLDLHASGFGTGRPLQIEGKSCSSSSGLMPAASLSCPSAPRTRSARRRKQPPVLVAQPESEEATGIGMARDTSSIHWLTCKRTSVFAPWEDSNADADPDADADADVTGSAASAGGAGGAGGTGCTSGSALAG